MSTRYMFGRLVCGLVLVMTAVPGPAGLPGSLRRLRSSSALRTTAGAKTSKLSVAVMVSVDPRGIQKDQPQPPAAAFKRAGRHHIEPGTVIPSRPLA